MTGSQVVLALAAAALEAALLAWALGIVPRGRGRAKDRLYPLLLAHVLGVLLFVGGGSAQATSQWLAAYSRTPAPPPFHAFAATGDPALSRWVAAQARPRYPRPPADATRLDAWSRGLRAYLDTTGFRLPALAGPPFAGGERELERVRLADGVERRLVTIPGFDGTPIPGYLFVPAGGGRRPAVMVISGHGDGIIETAGLVESYQHGNALALARAGFVTFTPELRGFGYLGGRIGAEHVAVAQNALLAGTSYKAVALHDLRLAAEWLAARPEVDSARMGVTGVSYGGEMSVALAAMEPRMRAVVAEGFSGGTGPLRPRTATSFANYHADHETLFSNRDLWQEDLFLLIAPRPLLMVSGTTDYQPPDAALVRLLNGVYLRAGRSADFATAQRPGDHEYFAEPAIAFFRAHL